MALARFGLKYVSILALLAITTSAVVADGLINPFDSSGISLSKEDSELMRGALRSVLDAKQAGATADWKSSSGELAGRATSLDVFQRNGMSCANVEHVFTAGGGSTYRLPFCQISDGT